MRPLAHGDLHQDGHQMALGGVILAQEPAHVAPADVEVPEKGEPEGLAGSRLGRGKVADDPLAHQLAASVRAHRILRARLGHGNHALGRVAVRRATRREDEPLDPVATAGLEHPRQARDVRVHVLEGLIDRLAHVRQGREVQHGVDLPLGEGRLHRRGVGDRPLDEGHRRVGAKTQQLQRSPMAAEEIVEDDHAMAALEQLLNRVRSDVARPAGDDEIHGSQG